jgi:hypothetical protein
MSSNNFNKLVYYRQREISKEEPEEFDHESTKVGCTKFRRRRGFIKTS